IESGEIGDPVLVQINAFEGFNPEPEHSRSWLLNRKLAGGGPMFDFGSHRIEVLLYIFGAIRDVKATAANVQFDRDVEDTAAAVFQFDSGTCAVLTVSHAAYEPQDSLDVFGSRRSEERR